MHAKPKNDISSLTDSLWDRRLLLANGALGIILSVIPARGRAQVMAQPTGPQAVWLLPAAHHPDVRVRSLGYALLAPNSFNLQPWSVDLVGRDDLILRAQPGRKSPACDGNDRQTVISLGAFLEVFRMAAAAEGYSVDVKHFPQGEKAGLLDDRVVATIALRPAAQPVRDPLLHHVVHRRSNKTPFIDRPVGDADLAIVRSAALDAASVGTVSEASKVAAVKAVALKAAMGEFLLPRMVAETAGFTRIGDRAIASDPWGIGLVGPAVAAAAADGTLTRRTLGDPRSQAAQGARARYARLIETGAAYVFLATATNSRHDQLAAGRDWVRLNLQATDLGLAFQPHSHSLHDYPERAADFAMMHRLLVPGGGRRVQMLARLGYAPVAMPPATARESASSVLSRSDRGGAA